MTAVVGILNKRGAAIAADSAVTRTRSWNQKVTKNGNKMIRVSNCVPVSVMLTGNGDFLRTQWDIIVRHYRQHRGDIPHETVEACVHDFFHYIAENKLFCKDSYIKSWIHHQMDEVFNGINQSLGFNVCKRTDDGFLKAPRSFLKAFLSKMRINRNHWLKDGVSEQFKDYDLKRFHDYLNGMTDDFLTEKEYSDCEFMNSLCFPKEILQELKEDFEETMMVYMTTRRYHEDGSAELIFTGYGTTQEYPSLVSTVVFEGFDDRVNYHICPKDIICISDDNPVAICPFAQKDVIKSILRGIHADYSASLINEMRNVYNPFMNDIFNIEEDEKEFEGLDNMDFTMLLQEIKVDDLDQKYCNAGIRYLDKNQLVWEKNLEDYDLLAMAALAQSLIDLTGFHRILTFKQEGVGGPVDLAVITKNDGFTWLSRKSWYHHKDIGGQYGVLGV